MKNDQEYININKAAWNNKTDAHLASEFYDLENFINGTSSLKDIELQLLGDVKGKKILHLQCHFGQDSISLSRMGAHVTGIDLSNKAIEAAISLASQTGKDTKFICCSVYDVLEHIKNETFDIVFTSYGVIGWLPDLGHWAKIISTCLKPAGQLVFVEFHPVVWMFDDYFKEIQYNYFKAKPIVENEIGTYADRNAPISQKSITWNHSTSEVLNSLINEGLEIKSFDEHDYSPYNCFNETVEFEPGKFRIKHLGNKIPMLFAVHAVKK